MSRADGILHCIVFARVYDLIAAGGKPVEYRDAETPVGRAAMRGGFHTIRFQRATCYWLDQSLPPSRR